MNIQSFNLTRIDAEPGKVFDWANLEEHTQVLEDGTIEQEHLYAKTLFLSVTDSIDNYIEVDAPVEVSDNE